MSAPSLHRGSTDSLITYVRVQEPYISVSRSPRLAKEADIPASTNEAYELSKFSGEAAYE